MMFPEYLLSAAEKLVQQSAAKGLRIATAESCTGGLVSALITEIPGSSAVFSGGVVAYANEAKMQLLEVDRALLDRYGAVSTEVAGAMAAGALRVFAADIALSITGIAGPGGGSAEKPVGLVYMAVAQKADPAPVIHRFQFNGTRGEIRLVSVEKAVALINTYIAP